MNLDTFINMCKSHDWEALFTFLGSSVKDLSTKILVSAIIQEHHPDLEIAKTRGLNACWGKKLSASPVPPALAMLSSAVDLSDFAGAYILAKAAKLDDKKAANAIADFVQTNKLQLGQYLTSSEVPQSEKELISQLFENLLMTKAEKEACFRKDFAQQAKHKIAFLQAQDQVISDFAQIFNLAESDFQITFCRKSNMRGIDSDALSSEGNIRFKKDISCQSVLQITNLLNHLDLSSNYYNMPSLGESETLRGIQLWSQPREIHEKLTTFTSYLAEEKNTEDSLTSPKQTQRFFKAAEVLKEIKSDLAESNIKNKP